VSGKMKKGEYLPLIPANALKNSVRIVFHDGKTRKNSSVFLNLEHVFNQNHPGSFKTLTGGYSLLNAGIQNGFDIKKFKIKLALNGTNLTDKKYISHLSRFKPEGIFDIGRSININLKLSI